MRLHCFTHIFVQFDPSDTPHNLYHRETLWSNTCVRLNMIVYTLNLTFSLNLSYGIKPNKAHGCSLIASFVYPQDSKSSAVIDGRGKKGCSLLALNLRGNHLNQIYQEITFKTSLPLPEALPQGSFPSSPLSALAGASGSEIFAQEDRNTSKRRIIKKRDRGLLFLFAAISSTFRLIFLL